MKDQTKEILAFSILTAGVFLFGIIMAILMDAHSERDKSFNICFIRTRSLFFIVAPCLIGMSITIGLFQKKYNLGNWYFFLIIIVAFIAGEIACNILKLHAKIKYEPVVE
ncbi:hypothetical protein GPICK_04155 [Geobacter pickeringii]|uniref:Uncharacterized protein n=2 Tax=Geobacter pickeringii TaxID=345632 RepID=A0A0B5B7X5_9BACT|nr:hypothetical protein GPICK_04155 [Geobacter pickeringii]